MMSVQDVVIKRLELIREQVKHLRTKQDLSIKQLADDPIAWNAVLHLLQTSAECLTDICAHLLSEKNYQLPDAHREIIVMAGRSRILPYDFAERVAPMASFRNIVVHQYLSIDPQKVDDIMKNHLSDFDDFIVYIYDYLRREGYIKDEKQDE